MFHFADPHFLLLLLVIPLLLYRHFRRRRQSSGTLRYSNLGLLKSGQQSGLSKYRWVPFLLRMLALIFLIVAFARPQAGQQEREILTEGIDIILSLDISSSMLAEDFKPNNRLEAAKLVGAKFIQGRQNDRIGLVVFAGQSFTQCPLTLDYGILLQFLQDIEIGMIEDGTAIGMAIANCVNRLRNSEAKSKVVILLTDGRNNRGELDPVTAAKVAQAFGIRIYTIGAGKEGQALYPIDDPLFGRRYVPMEVQIDEELLQRVAEVTGGKYFRATDETSLEKIYTEIGELEKTKIEIKEYTRYTELFVRFVVAAILLLLLELILSQTRFRKIP
ncbi:MAG TPA: VWA domain-containing protein [bacterium]|jgi:Ca-activated chloride channel family protein|nr:VWA domain-containing protein [bacterium]